MKTVEFVRRTKTGVLFVEVKTNVPNPATQIEWLALIKAELEERLRRWMKIWDIDVVVLSQDLAKRWGIIKEAAD